MTTLQGRDDKDRWRAGSRVLRSSWTPQPRPLVPRQHDLTQQRLVADLFVVGSGAPAMGR